jgi:hypothetical protein
MLRRSSNKISKASQLQSKLVPEPAHAYGHAPIHCSN